MDMKNLSIKGLILAILLVSGATAIALSVVAVVQFREAALESQTGSLARITEVAVREAFNKLDSLADDLATYTKKSGGFRKMVTQVINDPNNTEYTRDMAKILNDQYHQRYVTSSIVDLKKLRIFNLDFKLVAESSEGMSGLPGQLSETMLSKVRGRSGPDRLKLISDLWAHNDIALRSVLLPVGGLRQLGYLEIILSPEHNLRHVGEILQLPLSIMSTSGEITWKSDDWDASLNKFALPVTHHIKDDNNNMYLMLTTLENMETMYTRMFNTQATVIGLFIALTITGLVIAFWVLSKYLFRPTENLITAIEKCAAGNLTAHIDTRGLKELHSLSQALAILVNSLRNQVSVISTGSDNLSASAVELSHITQDTSNTVMKQRSETEQIATAINEMNAASAEVTSNACGAAEAANQARDEALNGQKVVAESMDAINAVANEVEKASIVIGNLQTESENIGTVLDVIKSIAEQTNLLALNAAIEAARAGEQGRGFAVVADEVRTLASRTQQSTREIEGMVEKLQTNSSQAVSAMAESQARASASVEQAGKASDSLQVITTAIGSISDMNTQIATAAEQQSAVADVINQNIDNITGLADHTSDSAKRVTDSSEDLSKMAAELKGLVGHFTVE